MHLACDDFRSKSVEVMRSETKPEVSSFCVCVGGDAERGNWKDSFQIMCITVKSTIKHT